MLTSRGDAPETEEVAPNVVVHRTVRDWAAPRTLGALNRLLRRSGAQVVHVFFPAPDLGGRYQVPAWLGAADGLPLVTTFWNLGLGRRSPASLRAASLALLARSDALSSHDPGYLSFLRRAGLGRPVRWLPVGSNVSSTGGRAAARARIGLGASDRVLAYFGQLDFTRGVEDLFEALALLPGAGSVRLVMIGSAGREHRYAGDPAAQAEFRRLRSLPGQLGVADRIEWTDYLPDAAVAERLVAADLCVLPYRRNSLGRSGLAAALELGVPTVLAGTPGGVEPLRPGRHVALVPPGDPPALAATLIRLLDDDEARARLADGALEAARFMAWPRIAAAATGLYREVLARRP